MDIRFLFGWAEGEGITLPTKADGSVNIPASFDLYNEWHKQNGRHEKLDKRKDVKYNNKDGKEKREAARVAFSTPSPKVFKMALQAAKRTISPEARWRVDDTYTESDYSRAKRYKTDGGSVVAVKEDGDIISLCRNKSPKNTDRGSDLLLHAVANGGIKLDAFGEDLYRFYTRNGFEPVSWTPFNREYAPHDWKPEYGEEPVIFYKYTGKRTQERYEDFVKRVKPHADYDTAKEKRDEEI